MKKLTAVVILVLVLFAAVSCGKKETAQSGTGTETQQAVNPMTMINDDSNFAKELGFKIDTSVVPVPGMARFIIDNRIAQMRFAIEKEGTEPIDVMFRATKDTSMKDTLSGLYGEATGPVTVELGGVTVTQKDIKEGERIHHQYDFEKDKILCTLVVTGELEPEETAELFAAFYQAVSK